MFIFSLLADFKIIGILHESELVGIFEDTEENKKRGMFF